MWPLSDREYLEIMRDHVLRRPGMYFGGKSGRDHIALANAIEALIENVVSLVIKGRCSQLFIALDTDGWITVQDDGPGLIVTPYRDSGTTFAEIVLTVVGGRHFDEERQRFSNSMFGVGFAAINVASEEAEVEVRRDGYLWFQHYENGDATTPFQTLRPLERNEATGTRFRFRPGTIVFDEEAVDRLDLVSRLQELAYLLPQLTILYRDERFGKVTELSFHYPDGIVQLVEQLTSNQTPLHEVIVIHTTAKADLLLKSPEVQFQCAFRYVVEPESSIIAFANAKSTYRGEHIEAFLDTIAFQISAMHPTYSNKSVRQTRAGHDSNCLPGLYVVINCWIAGGIVVESQRPPHHLLSPVKQALWSPLVDAFNSYFETNPDVAHIIAERWTASRKQST